MEGKLSSYVLVGINAVPVDGVVKGKVQIVATRSRRVLHSVKLPAPDAGTLLTGSGVQVTPRKRAPARMNAGHLAQYCHAAQSLT
jgi:hypothetical protein